VDILMPQLGETVTEGTIAAWHKQAGDTVEKDEMLLDVETDKVATEIPAPVSGVLSSINVDEGATVDVGTVLAVISVEGETAATSAPAKTRPVAATAAVSEVGLPGRTSGHHLSPVVRRLVRRHQLEVSAIVGTGRAGRIKRQDVLDHIEAGGSAPPTGGGTEEERIPFDRIRRATAEHMVRSKATSAHVLQTIDADFSAVDRVRLAQREKWRAEHGYSLSYLPFVARALCLTLAEFPRINASIEEQTLILHREINLAIAVDLDFEGLLAPVVRSASGLKVSELARQFHQLAARAKSGALSTDDLQGGTYTLSNPGPFGTLFTAPIINQPQVAILSMDAVKKRPVVVESETGDSVGIRPIGMLAHSFDHRAIDGAYSAAFLNRLKKTIEATDWSLEL
jgi:pyruvate dehydrogenase E2 component (dihydrolipoamide acetyltransferase)